MQAVWQLYRSGPYAGYGVDTYDVAQVIAGQTEVLERYRLDIAQYA